jgi:predicted PurR-regulated permease PerM
MPLLVARAGRVVLTILVILAGLAFVWAAWHVLVTFLFAIFFAYLIDPVVEFAMRRLKLSRGKAIASVYLVIFAGLAVLFLVIGPAIVGEARKLADSLPQLYQKVATGQIAWQLGAAHGWSYETKLNIQQFLAAHSADITGLAHNFGTRLARLGSNAWWLVLIPILAVFFLKDAQEFKQSALEIFERRRQREFAEAVMNDVHMMLAHYIRAQMILAALAMAVYIAGLNVLRVPYGTILGVIAGFWEFIPIVGPLISFLLITGVALGAGYKHLLVLVLFLGIWRGIQDYVNSPRIMGRQLQLHPLAALFGILSGAEVGGIIGVYLSIPVMATARIFWRHWQAYSHQRASAAGVSELTPALETANCDTKRIA